MQIATIYQQSNHQHQQLATHQCMQIATGFLSLCFSGAIDWQPTSVCRLQLRPARLYHLLHLLATHQCMQIATQPSLSTLPTNILATHQCMQIATFRHKTGRRIFDSGNPLVYVDCNLHQQHYSNQYKHWQPTSVCRLQQHSHYIVLLLLFWQPTSVCRLQLCTHQNHLYYIILATHQCMQIATG